MDVAIRIDDLFHDDEGSSFWSEPAPGLRRDLLERALREALPNVPDVEFADALVRLTHAELQVFGTSGTRYITEDEDIQLVIRAAGACCRRIGVDFPNLPFRDFTTFKKYWKAEGMAYSYAARREYLEALFDPLRELLSKLAIRTWADNLSHAISPHPGTGWAGVDSEIRELRRRFEFARTPQDHCAVGAACVRILEEVGEVAFDPTIHLPSGEPAPRRDQTKAQFDMIVSFHLSGQENERVRKLARSVVELAQEVKHSKTPSRRDAGIVGDAVIQLVNMLRRITTN